MKRQLKGAWKSVFFWGTLLFAAFHLYTGGFGFLPDLKQRAVHITFGLSLAFLSRSFRRQGKPTATPTVWDIILIAIVVATNLNIYLLYENIYLLPGGATTKELVFGILLSLVILESARRVVGWVIPAMLGLAFVYIFVSRYLPGAWGFRGVSFKHVFTSLYYSPDAIYGPLTGICATLVAVFIIFGAFLLFTEGGGTFIDFALKVAGRFRGGPAKVAVIASAFFGTVSGSSAANVMATGNFTIPLMKGLGYLPHFAGGVEAVSSTGGMITPPIMAAGAFIMSELLGVPYIKIVYYAIIPCMLYYACVFSSVHFEALRLGLNRIPEDKIPSWKSILKWSRLAPLVIPVSLLLILMIKGYSITFAGFLACMSVIVLFLFSSLSISGIKERLLKIGSILSYGGEALIDIVPLIVSMGMLISLFSMSGVLVKLSTLVMEVAQSSFIAALVLAALVPLLLGMVIPAAPAYILSVAIMGPGLIRLGLDAIPVNMFFFYLSVISAITPPVCIACFVAAGIARASWFKVALVAIRLGAVGFIMPFFFVTQPALIGIGEPLEIARATLCGLIGAVCIASGSFGYLTHKLSILSRILLVPGGVLLLYPNPFTEISGALLVVFALCLQAIMSRVALYLAKRGDIGGSR